MGVPVFYPASAAPVPAYIPGRWYATSVMATGSGIAVASGIVRMYPFYLRARITVSTLMARVATAGGGSFQLAIYGNNSATGRPTGAVLARTGDMSNLALAAVTGDITGADVTLEAGVYWAATNVDAASGAMITQSLNANNAGTSTLSGVADPDIASSSASASLSMLTTPMAYNTWSSMTSAVFTEVAGTGGAAHVWLKAA